MLAFLCSAASGATNSSWFARSWQAGDGLPHNNVLGLAQTSDGYLWLGTPNGLVNFDGVRFQRFAFTNSLYADNRGVVTMLRSRAGGFWVGMDRGAIVYLDGTAPKVFTRADGLLDHPARWLAEDGQGTLWVVFQTGDIHCRIEEGKVTTFSIPRGSPGGSLSSVTCDAAGRLWWAQGGEVGIYRDGHFHRIAEPGGSAIRLARARSGGVWVCAGTRLMRCTDNGDVLECGEFKPEHADTGATVLWEDSSSAVWIATSFSGLFRFDGAQFENVPVSAPDVQSLLEDREGNLWAGTVGGGLNRIRRRVVQLEGIESGLPFEAVRSLAEDKDGTLWAVTENGSLARRINRGWQPVSTNESWRGLNLTCLAADREGGLWIGTENRKLLRWQAGQLAVCDQSDHLTGGRILALQASGSGELWIGQVAPDAFQCLRGGKLVNYKLPSDVRTIRALAEDAQGTVWLGTARGQLMRVQGDELVKETALKPERAISIRCLKPTPDGSLWIGYARLGLGRLKEGRYARLGLEQGLFDDYLSQILADEGGWLWFGSDHGIFKVRQQELEAVAEGGAERVRSIHYGHGEGVPNLQANFGFSPGALRSKDGRLWLPSRSGLAVVDPKPLRSGAGPPSVVLTQATVDGKAVARYESITLGAGETHLERLGLEGRPMALRLPPDYRRFDVEFTALSFADPENIRFRYQLVGLDEGWLEAGTQRNATYSRLSAGQYRFRVRACNAEGVWSETGPSLAITVLPYFWQTVWFIVPAGLLLLGTVGLGVRLIENRRVQRHLARLEHAHAIERERARIAKDIHDDLGANLTEITLLSELAQDPAAPFEEVQNDICRIARKARDLTHSLDEIVWAVNPRNDTLDSLVTYTCLHAEDYLGLASVRCRLKVPEKIPNLALATDVRHNVFLVVKEALHNVVKHAAASEVSIAMALEAGGFELVIKDNGRGFDPKISRAAESTDASPPSRTAGRSAGNGLSNMRQRMEDIGGQFDLLSHPGAGTTIRLAVACHSFNGL